MKKTVFSMAALFMAACTSHSGYVIKGTIDGVDTGTVVLTNYSQDCPIADSTSIRDGQFVFTGHVVTPELYYLNIAGYEPGQWSFFLDNGEITIRAAIDSLNEMELQGPATTLFAKSLADAERDFYASWPYDYQALVSEYQDAATSPERKEEIVRIAGEAEERVDELQKTMCLKYVGDHPASPYTAYILRRYTDDFAVEELETALAALQEALPDNRFVQYVAAVVPAIKATAEGQTAPDFTQNDPDGAPLTFSEVYVKNKLTMIDFWASWCGPCRRFNPTLVALYQKYRDRGLEIVAVSLDSKQENWTAAIAKDGLTWRHVSDLGGWGNAVAAQYNIRYIPQNVFVDAAGKIVGKRIPEAEMDAFLSMHLN